MIVTTKHFSFAEYLTYNDGSDRVQSSIFPDLQLTATQILNAGAA